MVLVSLVPLCVLLHHHICSHQMPCYSWKVRLASSFDEQRGTVRHCLTSLAMFLSLSEFFFGRPALTLGDLMDTGPISMAELGHCHKSVPLRSSTFVYPVSKVWPMGYSWSSFIAQNCMLAVCRAAMLTNEKCLSVDLPLAKCLSESFGLATDDICHFTTNPIQPTPPPEVFAKRGSLSASACHRTSERRLQSRVLSQIGMKINSMKVCADFFVCLSPPPTAT